MSKKFTFEIYDEFCSLCTFNGGREKINGEITDNVLCNHVHKYIPLTFDICAAQTLTERGWIIVRQKQSEKLSR